MKKVFTILFAAATVSVAAASCTEKELAPVMPDQPAAEDVIPVPDEDEMVEVCFQAEIAEVATKATLTPNEDESAFAGAWADGDQIQFSYSAGRYSGTTTATWSDSKGGFTASLPSYTGSWSYSAISYPAPNSSGVVDFGGERTQNGSNINSKYDVMVVAAEDQPTVANAAAGVDASGAPVVFRMTRQTAIAYYHFTSSLNDDTVKSVSMKVTGGVIASDNASISGGTFSANVLEDGLEEITVTFEEGTNPSASDFTVWFNVLPSSYESVVVTVVTVGGKTVSLTKNKAGQYVAGRVSKVVATIPDAKWADVVEEDDPDDGVLTSIQEIFDAATAAGTSGADATVQLKNWVVSGVRGTSNVYVTDGTKGFIIYGSGHGFAVGDVLSGTVSCKVQLYNNSAELTSLTSTTSGLSVTKGGSVAYRTAGIAELSGVNTGSLVSLGRLTYNGSVFTDGTNEVKVFDAFSVSPTLTSGKVYDVKGMFILYNSTKEIAPMSASDFVEVSDPVITTGDASDVTIAGATLNASYSSETKPYELYFEYGTSEALGSKVYYNDVLSTSGDVSVSLTGLAEGTTYYYRAYMQVGTGDYYGAVKTFTTSTSGGSGGGSTDETTFAKSWLACYEVPATTVTLASGNPYHSYVSETYGDSKAYIYNPSSSTQRVVAHTFKDGSDVKRNYTMLFDKDLRCALWCAFAMHGTEYKDNNVGRQNGWDYDPAIPTSWQPNLTSSYPDGNYDRGHQVASNDRQTLTGQNKQTFYFSNMTPQWASLNQGKWAAFEGEVQSVGNACSGRDTLYVVTGPVFRNTNTTTNDNSGVACAVPTGYYKCLMKCTFNTSGVMTAATGCGYLVDSNSSNIAPQAVTIDSIESLVGFDFFANVPASLQNSAEGAVSKFSGITTTN